MCFPLPLLFRQGNRPSPYLVQAALCYTAVSNPHRLQLITFFFLDIKLAQRQTLKIHARLRAKMLVIQCPLNLGSIKTVRTEFCGRPSVTSKCPGFADRLT